MPTKACGLSAGSTPDLAYWESAVHVVAAAASRSYPSTARAVSRILRALGQASNKGLAN
jgi:hypothetical protein